jgi:Crinkler effector protein N-terminal domain
MAPGNRKPKSIATSTQPIATVPAGSTSKEKGKDTSIRLLCLIEGDHSVFDVDVPRNSQITTLKRLVHKDGINVVQNPIDAKDLVLLKVSFFRRLETNSLVHALAGRESYQRPS